MISIQRKERRGRRYKKKGEKEEEELGKQSEKGGSVPTGYD